MTFYTSRTGTSICNNIQFVALVLLVTGTHSMCYAITTHLCPTFALCSCWLAAPIFMCTMCVRYYGASGNRCHAYRGWMELAHIQSGYRAVYILCTVHCLCSVSIDNNIRIYCQWSKHSWNHFTDCKYCLATHICSQLSFPRYWCVKLVLEINSDVCNHSLIVTNGTLWI